MASNSSGALPEMLPSALESLFPGFSLFSRIMTFYFNIDISSYSVYLVLFAVLPLFFGFVIPRFLNNLQQLLLFFTASIEIRYQDTLYAQFMKWMSINDALKQGWCSVAQTKDTFVLPWQDEEADDDQHEDPVRHQDIFDNNRELFWRLQRHGRGMKPIRYTPSQNQVHLFRYQGWILGLRRTPHSNINNPWFARAETITIYAFLGNKQVLIDLLQEVQKASLDQKSDHISIYRGLKRQNIVSWVRATSKSPRPLSTLVSEVKEAFKEDVENFLNPKNRPWYQSRGIPYRRGYLLHGPPGTGKSSMCFAIAGYLRLDIYTISLNSRKLDEDGLASLFQDLPERCIVLLEDVDNAGIRQEGSRWTQGKIHDDGSENSSEDNEPTGISLSALLNVLDGVGAHEGRILFMTTNHITKLDDALTRPGRVDKTYYFGFADKSCIKQLFRVFYTKNIDESTYASSDKTSKDPASDLTSGKGILDLSIQFAKIVPSGQLTAAEIYSYLMDFKSDPEAAVSKVKEWLDNKEFS